MTRPSGVLDVGQLENAVKEGVCICNVRKQTYDVVEQCHSYQSQLILFRAAAYGEELRVVIKFHG